MNTEQQRGNDHEKQDGHHAHTLQIFVDGEPHKSQDASMKPDDIISTFGGKDPTTSYLVKIRGREQESYQGKGQDPIQLHNGDKFQIISTGPTTVSDQNTSFGVAPFMMGLADLGYAPHVLPGKSDHVYFAYEVPCGRLAGKVVKLGFIVPSDFPLAVPSGPHVSPSIHPHQSGGTHPTGGIHPSKDFQAALGEDWQYWSRPFKGDWGSSRKTVAAYMSHIFQLWNSQ